MAKRRGRPKGSKNKSRPEMTTSQRAVLRLARLVLVEPLEKEGYNILPKNSPPDEARQTFLNMTKADEFDVNTKRYARLFARALKP